MPASEHWSVMLQRSWHRDGQSSEQPNSSHDAPDASIAVITSGPLPKSDADGSALWIGVECLPTVSIVRRAVGLPRSV